MAHLLRHVLDHSGDAGTSLALGQWLASWRPAGGLESLISQTRRMVRPQVLCRDPVPAQPAVDLATADRSPLTVGPIPVSSGQVWIGGGYSGVWTCGSTSTIVSSGQVWIGGGYALPPPTQQQGGCNPLTLTGLENGGRPPRTFRSLTSTTRPTLTFSNLPSPQSRSPSPRWEPWPITYCFSNSLRPPRSLRSTALRGYPEGENLYCPAWRFLNPCAAWAI